LFISFVFISLGYLAHELKWNDTWCFFLNYLAIIFLSKLLEFATEEVIANIYISLFLQRNGGILNAIFGNAMELIVSIIALIYGQITVV
ncbi:hypothetical protein C1645_662939, partial [Glomus cerebriforme]